MGSDGIPKTASRATRTPGCVRLFAMDIDGTLTDGSITTYRDETAMHMCVLDGLGIQRVIEAGIIVAWISGRTSDAVQSRAAQLGVAEVWLGEEDKLARLKEIAVRHSIAPEDIAYMGDDLPDLPAMRYCGYAFAPPNAVPPVRREAACVTKNRGGHGAVREVCERILGAAASNGLGMRA